MKCPICGKVVWTSKSERAELRRDCYRRSMRCNNCADSKTLTVYRCHPISDKEMAEVYSSLVSPPLFYHNPPPSVNGVGNFFQL